MKTEQALKVELNKRYMVSRAVNICVSEKGKFFVYNSLSRPLKEINMDLILILNSFLDPVTFAEAHEMLSKIYDLSENELKTIVTQLLNLNILTIEQTIPVPVIMAKDGFASLTIHHDMLKDTVRVMAYKTAIMSQVKGKKVIDLGCGTGILSLFAAKAGAAKVIAIEESSIASIAKQMFKKNGADDIVTLYKANSKDVKLKEKADILIHEIIGMDPLDENILMYIEDAKKRLLKKNGKLIPGRMEICCVAYEHNFPKQFEVETRLFSELYGLSFEPYLNSIKTEPEQKMGNNIHIPENNFFRKKIISEETVLYDIDFNNKVNYMVNYPSSVKLKIKEAGTVCGVLIYFKAHLGEGIVLSTSPYSPPTHWGQKDNRFPVSKKVLANSFVNLEFNIKNINGKQKIGLEIL